MWPALVEVPGPPDAAVLLAMGPEKRAALDRMPIPEPEELQFLRDSCVEESTRGLGVPPVQLREALEIAGPACFTVFSCFAHTQASG